MKHAVPSFLLLATLAATGCTTLANRRDLFRPSEAKGPYTEMLDEGRDKPRVQTQEEKKESDTNREERGEMESH